VGELVVLYTGSGLETGTGVCAMVFIPRPATRSRLAKILFILVIFC
jgi:hypothetical protein